jgi:primase-polymerase (primpol)-like protein
LEIGWLGGFSEGKFRSNDKGLIRMLSELKEMRIWLIFKYTKDGQKIPCWPSTGKYGLKWRDPKNLRTYPEAAAAKARFHAAGIGLVIPIGFAVVDLDHCYPTSGALPGDNADANLNPVAGKLSIS